MSTPKRPLAEWQDGKKLPIPWLVESSTKPGELATEWTGFDDARIHRGHSLRLCQICGKRVKVGELVHLIANISHLTERPNVKTPSTSGCGMHASCALLAIRVCPHYTRMTKLTESTVVAWLWAGRGQGYNYRDANGRVDWETVGGDYTYMREGGKLLTLQQLKKRSLQSPTNRVR